MKLMLGVACSENAELLSVWKVVVLYAGSLDKQKACSVRFLVVTGTVQMPTCSDYL